MTTKVAPPVLSLQSKRSLATLFDELLAAVDMLIGSCRKANWIEVDESVTNVKSYVRSIKDEVPGELAKKQVTQLDAHAQFVEVYAGKRNRQYVLSNAQSIRRSPLAAAGQPGWRQARICNRGKPLSTNPGLTEWVVKRQRSREELGDEKELRRRLSTLGEARDQGLLLSHNSGQALSISVQGRNAHVMFIPSSSSEPVLVASSLPPERISKKRFVRFTIGGTPTRILRDLCIPIETMADVAVYFFKRRALAKFVNWIELDWP